MKLISCDNCGVVLDADKLAWPFAYDDDGCAVPEAIWDNSKDVHVVPTPCPVCESDILED